MIKGGFAWLLWQGGVVNNVVDWGTSNGVSLVVYQREEGEETMNTLQTDAYRCLTCKYRCQVCPNAVGGDTDEGGKHPGKYPRCFAFSDR